MIILYLNLTNIPSEFCYETFLGDFQTLFCYFNGKHCLLFYIAKTGSPVALLSYSCRFAWKQQSNKNPGSSSGPIIMTCNIPAINCIFCNLESNKMTLSSTPQEA